MIQDIFIFILLKPNVEHFMSYKDSFTNICKIKNPQNQFCLGWAKKKSFSLALHLYMLFSSSVPSLLPSSLPHHPSPLFLKFHNLLLTPSTDDLFSSLFILGPTHLSHFLSLCPFLCLALPPHQVLRGFGL